MKTGLLAAIIFLLPAMVMAEALETAFLPNGAEYLVDRFIITTTIDTPPLEMGNVVAGTAFTGVTSIDNLCAQYNVVKVEPFYDGPVKSVGLRDLVPRMYIFHVATGADVMAAQSGFNNASNIETSDLYDIPKIAYEPDDPQRNVQWHLTKIQGYEAWDVIRGDTTRHAIISIVDTGVYWMHRDLAPNMWINELEDINGNGIMDDDDFNGIDDDDNGYIDDVVGWDNGSNDNDPSEESPTHGTHVAGCASEATDNGLNGAGIGFSARIMANKGANSAGQLTAVYPAMLWATENGAHIINCSWGSTYYNGAYQNLINGIWNSGVVVVAAAGNENNSQNFYPAAYNNVLSVAATNSSDHRANFSSYGEYVDVAAPGVGIWATWATGGFSSLQGTSMASPITAGTCGLLKAAFPDYTNADIVETIIATTDDIDDLNPGYEGMLGSGRINAYAALVSTTMPNIILEGMELTITDGDGDESLNPGESFSLVVSLHNSWADADNVSGTLRSSDIFTVSDSVADFGNIRRNQTIDNGDTPFTVSVNSDVLLDSYAIILEVSSDGYETTLEVIVEISLHQDGFPKEIAGQIESSPLIFDVNRDGDNELIFGANDDKVYVVESDGRNLTGWPKSVSGDVISGPAVGDLAAVGTYQVVAVSKSGRVYVWNADGSSYPNFPVNIGGLFFSGVMLVDIDGDSDLEIVTGSFSDNNVYAIHHDGTEVDGWPYNGSANWYGNTASGDFDGDMISEVVCAGFDSLVSVIDADGNQVSGFPVNLGAIVWAASAIGDIDGDQQTEIVTVTASGEAFAINHDGSMVDGFPVTLGGLLRSSPSLGDLDGDGYPEIVFGSNNQMVYVLKGDGSQLEGFPQETDNSITASPVIGDITGDGQPDIIVGTNGGMLYGFASDGSMLDNFPIQGSTNGAIGATPALGDLDGDGDMEIAVGIKGAGNNLMVIDYKPQASTDNLIWPSFGKDIWRSGNLSDVVTSADDEIAQPITFGLAQNYPNPFNAKTTIQFNLATRGEVELSVFDLLGRNINVLNSEILNAGAHSMVWDGTNKAGDIVASGIYFYRLSSPDGTETRRMLLLK
ncbi:MAG: S8 family serine peptidase [candidate division Zixibacteria bacterium]